MAALTLGGATTAHAQQPATSPTTPAAPAKQWVWLKTQGLWGYGYQRADGYWIVDPGSKRTPGQVAAQRTAQAQQVAAQEATTDPYGFVGWLNATRGSFGLPPVGHDPNLSNWASMNNAQQQARGMGHHVMGPARRQNAAMGNAGTVGSQWMASPAHRAALLDPSIRWIGIAGMGAYWTFNAY